MSGFRKTVIKAALAAGVMAISTSSTAQEAVTVKPDLESIAREVSKARNVQEIQNLMARRMYYHSIGHNEQELALWSKKQEIRWAQNQGCWVGMDSLKVYYDDVNRKMQAADLKRMAAANPLIEDVPENRGIGNSAIHTLTSPIVVIADDGMSAKATWYTPGIILSSPDGKTPNGSWIWERYAADFVNEDGEWRFLNLQVNTDFMNPMGSKMQIQAEDAAAMGMEGGGGEGGPPMPEGLVIPGPDVPFKTYTEFAATRVPTITPRMPEPYKTLSETFQYATCK